MDLISELYYRYNLFNGEKGFIGTTHCGYKIPYFKIGKGEKKIIVTSCIHAREFVTAYLSFLMMDEYKIKPLKSQLYFIPIVNIDGVKILNEIPDYKANARGVDLNTNFPAKFGTGKFNLKKVGKENYIGKFSASEEETRALMDFTIKTKPDLTLSLHAKGEEIYYDFFDEKLKTAHYRFALKAQKATGYKIVENLASAGGYKDWCISALKIPSLTIEVGEDALSHPIEKWHARKIYKKIKRLIPYLEEELYEK